MPRKKRIVEPTEPTPDVDPLPDPSSTMPPTGRFAYDGLERVFHEKARLGLLTSLVSRPEGLVFSELKALCALTDGNLSRHLAVLQEAGLIEVFKGYQANRPQTLCRVTPVGRARFFEYITILENVVADAMEAAHTSSPPVGRPPDGWLPA